MPEFVNRRHTFQNCEAVSASLTPGTDEGVIPEETTLYGHHTATSLKALCVTPTCRFRVRFCRGEDGSWKVEFLFLDVGEVSIWGKRLGFTAYQAPMRADIFVPRIIAGLSLTRNDIVHALGPYLQKAPSNSFIARVRKSAIMRCSGRPDENVGRLLVYFWELNRLGQKSKHCDHLCKTNGGGRSQCCRSNSQKGLKAGCETCTITLFKCTTWVAQ